MRHWLANPVRIVLLSALWIVASDALAIKPSLVAQPLAKRSLTDFRPHDDKLRYVAMGDSYMAGPGSGKAFRQNGEWNENEDEGDEKGRWDDNKKCRRTIGSLAVMLKDQYPFEEFSSGSAQVEFTKEAGNFMACTGDTMKGMLESGGQLQQLGERLYRPDFILLSVGGNDALFSKILKNCALGLRVFPLQPTPCDEVLAEAAAVYQGDEFKKNLKEVYSRAFAQLDRTSSAFPDVANENKHKYQIYQMLYPKPFSEQTNDGWCNGVTIWENAKTKSLKFAHKDIKLTTDLRGKINKMVNDLNAKIVAIGEEWEEEEFDENSPAGNAKRLFHVDPNPQWDGHRFCEEGARDHIRNNIWFIPISGQPGAEPGPPTTDGVAGIDMPEKLQQIFHPRATGFQGSLVVLKEMLKEHRGTDSCSLGKRDERACPMPPGKKSGALNIILEQIEWGIPEFHRREMNWLFYPTDIGTASQCSDNPIPVTAVQARNDIRGIENGYMRDGCPILTSDHDPNNLPEGCETPNYDNEVPFPPGEYDVKIQDEDCRYKNDGTEGNTGAVWCGSNLKSQCKAHADKEKLYQDGVAQCPNLSNPPDLHVSKSVSHRAVVVCEWS